MANICFTVLHYRTPFVYALSVELERRGHSVYFLCPSLKWRNWLCGKGVDERKILDQTPSVKSSPLSAEELSFLSEIGEAEQKSGLTLNSMILMDRLVREWDSEYAYNYLVRLYILVKGFIQQHRIDLVIGEATPASELLTSVICESVGIPYYFPITTRVPDGRFAFFKGRFHAEFALNKKISNEDRDRAIVWVDQFLASFAQKKPKPSYWYRNNKLPQVQISWVVKFFRTLLDEYRYGRSDPTRFGVSWLFKKRVSEVFNRFRIRGVKFYESCNLEGERFVLYPLHKQPESSVDVLGDFYSDQLNLIRQIVRSLPVGCKLYVKEHSNAIGDRSFGFYKEIESLPNVRLISPYEDSFGLLGRAAVVVTVSGTMAYEAGLLGRPAITLAKMFFNGLPSVRYCHAVRDLPQMINEQICFLEKDGGGVDFMVDLYLNSFEGVFSDVNAYPEVVEERNVCAVSDAIESVI